MNDEKSEGKQVEWVESLEGGTLFARRRLPDGVDIFATPNGWGARKDIGNKKTEIGRYHFEGSLETSKADSIAALPRLESAWGAAWGQP